MQLLSFRDFLRLWDCVLPELFCFILFCSVLFETGSHCIDQADLELI